MWLSYTFLTPSSQVTPLYGTHILQGRPIHFGVNAGYNLAVVYIPVILLPSRHTTWNPRLIGEKNWWTRVPLKIQVYSTWISSCVGPIIGVDLHVDIKWRLSLIFFTCRETGAPWDMGSLKTGLFDTEIILRFVRHLVNGTKTNQYSFSTLLLMAVGHSWYVCKLRSIFYTISTFLGWSMFVSIDHVILDFPTILVASYTCAITL